MDRGLFIQLYGGLVDGNHLPVHGKERAQAHSESNVDHKCDKDHRHHGAGVGEGAAALGMVHCEELEELRQEEGDSGYGRQGRVKQEEQEELVVEEADTVDHPYAVVVHFEDAGRCTRAPSPLWHPRRLGRGASQGGRTPLMEDGGEVAPAQHEHQEAEEKQRGNAARSSSRRGCTDVANVGVCHRKVGYPYQPKHHENHHVAQELEALTEPEAVHVCDLHSCWEVGSNPFCPGSYIRGIAVPLWEGRGGGRGILESSLGVEAEIPDEQLSRPAGGTSDWSGDCGGVLRSIAEEGGVGARQAGAAQRN
eukprot:CAMPEP_0117692464 /NCGR_PEP_ID=MMETSP0804-20121206/26345_1 /TAXON_ID=1074897 /ORGANISM="Tetraselmis astigmatica, Strain CCMP880" /LENGTH=307 /DNA_ID=CAMNT_0005505921 /DNA_START=383 /DNA_END=1307 /DNA_ORIENTATION=+